MDNVVGLVKLRQWEPVLGLPLQHGHGGQDRRGGLQDCWGCLGTEMRLFALESCAFALQSSPLALQSSPLAPWLPRCAGTSRVVTHNVGQGMCVKRLCCPKRCLD